VVARPLMVNPKLPHTTQYSMPNIEAYDPFFSGEESFPVRPIGIANKGHVRFAKGQASWVVIHKAAAHSRPAFCRCELFSPE
jgi:hypothetical protein